MTATSPARRGAICPRRTLPARVLRARSRTGVVREIFLGRVEAIREAADGPVRVAVEAYRDPEGAEHPPTIRLTLSSASDPDDADADDLTSAEARDLAGALLEAARLAES